MSLKMEVLVNEELLRDRLTPVRELCPFLLDLFVWRREVYPAVLTLGVTTVFSLVWYYDPSIITAFSMLGLLLTLGDYTLPLLSKTMRSGAATTVPSEGPSPSSWSSEQEKKFSIFVNRIAYYSVQVWNFQVTLEEWKRDWPNAYSASVVVALLATAWIGSAVNNLFLTYLFCLFMVLLPGLLYRRLPQIYLSKLILAVSSLIGKGKKNN